MAAILDFTRNAITTKLRSGYTPMSYMLWNLMVHTKIMILLLFKQNNTNLLFHVAQIAAIFDFNNKPMFKVLSDYVTISGITKTLMLHTKIKNLHLFC